MQIQSLPDLKERILAMLADGGGFINMNHFLIGAKTRCLAGWIIKAHPQGDEVNDRTCDFEQAANLICSACGILPPNFHDFNFGCNERAMNWLRTGNQSDN